jgi:predicted porin
LALVGAASAQTTDGKPGFQITGQFNAGFVSQNYFGKKVSGFEQNGMGTSQLMFRGLEDLGGGLKAYFFHDTDIQFMSNGDRGSMYSATNAGAVGTFGNDQKYVGVQGGFGNIGFGTFNNQSLILGIGTLNPFWGTSYSGGYGSVNCADPTCTIVRYDNSIEYKSPVISGFQGYYQNSQKQTKAVNTNYVTTLGALNMPGMTEVGLKYSNGPLTIGYADLQTDATGVATAATAATKKSLKTLTGVYDLGNGLRLAYMNQKLDNGTLLAYGGAKDMTKSQDKTTNQYAVQYTMGASTFGYNYGTAKENNALRTTYGGQTSKFTGVAYRYELTKMTSLQAKWESLDDQAGTTNPIVPNQFGTRENNKRTRSTLGMRMDF